MGTSRKRVKTLLLATFLMLPFLSQAGDSIDIADLVSSSSSCIDPILVSPCIKTKNGVPQPGLRVKTSIPVMLVETVRGPGDFFFMPVPPSPILNDRYADSGQEGYGVRIWGLGDYWEVLAKVIGLCVACTPKSQQPPPFRDDISSTQQELSESVDSDDIEDGVTSTIDDLSDGSYTNETGETVDVPPVPSVDADSVGGICTAFGATEQLMAAASDLANFGYFKLIYTSELDLLNWRTGCHDKVDAYSSGGLAAMECALESLAETGVSVIGSDAIPDLGNGQCIGAWGPLKPRQYLANGSGQSTAALTAYRALHYSKSMNLHPYMVNTSGKLQFAWPKVSQCFRPGISQLELTRHSPVSQNGNYAFIYWQVTDCCLDVADATDCLAKVGEESVN